MLLLTPASQQLTLRASDAPRPEPLSDSWESLMTQPSTARNLTGPIVMLLFLLAGCVRVNSTPVDPSASYAPVPADEVRIFENEDEIPTSYEKVAIFHAEGTDSWTDQSDMLEKIREEAAKKGCNGLILGEIEEAGTGEKIANAFLGTGADREGRAIGIRWGELSSSESAGSGSKSEVEDSGDSSDDDGSGIPHYHVRAN